MCIYASHLQTIIKIISKWKIQNLPPPQKKKKKKEKNNKPKKKEEEDRPIGHRQRRNHTLFKYKVKQSSVNIKGHKH